MDDLPNHETLEGLVALLPPAGDFRAVLAQREQAQEAFIRRGDAWARARAGGRAADVVVVFPDDAAAVAALGVPCHDCHELVFAEGEAGHHIRFGVEAGRHWAALILARCGGPA